MSDSLDQIPTYRGVQSALPERQDNPLPPAFAGEAITASKLNAFRRTQLCELAKAFAIDIPDEATKNQMLPTLIAAEQLGKFRQPPVSRYHFLMAMRDPDVRMEDHQLESFEKELRQALLVEQKRALTKGEKIAIAGAEAKRDPNSVQSLRMRCKVLGINSWGKKREWMQEQIAAKELADAEDADAAALLDVEEKLAAEKQPPNWEE